MNSFISQLPKQLLASLIGLLIFLQLMVIGAGYYQRAINASVMEIRTRQQNFLTDIQGRVQAEAGYRSFVHLLGLKKILSQRQNTAADLDRLAKMLPRAFKLSALTLSQPDRRLTLEGRLATPEVGVRLSKYFYDLRALGSTKQSFLLTDQGLQLIVEGQLQP